MQDASKLEHLAKENYILKKAVLVQSQRLTEAQASLSELPALRAQVWLPCVSQMQLWSELALSPVRLAKLLCELPCLWTAMPSSHGAPYYNC